MTAKKDLKRRVRERQARTGESYTAARAQVVSQREDLPPPSDESRKAISVIEMVNATDEAAKLGFKCDVLMSPSVVARVPAARVLERVRDALLATESDVELLPMRALALRGLSRRARSRRSWDELRRFFQRCRVGIGGTTEAGDMMAIQIDALLVIVQIGYPAMDAQHKLYITTVESHWLDDLVVLPVP